MRQRLSTLISLKGGLHHHLFLKVLQSPVFLMVWIRHWFCSTQTAKYSSRHQRFAFRATGAWILPWTQAVSPTENTLYVRMVFVEYGSIIPTQLTANPDTPSMNLELLILIFVTNTAGRIKLFQCNSGFANRNKQKTHTWVEADEDEEMIPVGTCNHLILMATFPCRELGKDPAHH